MSIGVKIYSHKTLSIVGSLELGDAVEASEEEIVLLLEKIGVYRDYEYNVQLNFRDYPVHQVLKLKYADVKAAILEMVGFVKRAFDAGDVCSECKIILNYIMRTEEEVDIIMRQTGTRMRVLGISEAKCPGCHHRFMQFEKIVEMSVL